MATISLKKEWLEILQTEPWQTLKIVLRDASTPTCQELIANIQKLKLATALRDALQAAAQGEIDPMNDWLFSLSPSYDQPIIWLAPIREGNRAHYAWMIGFQSPLTEEIRARFEQAGPQFSTDKVLLQQPNIPLVKFVVPVEVSAIQSVVDTEYDRFAIFQTGQKAVDIPERPDSEQRFILNAKYLVDYRSMVIGRARKLGITCPALDVLEENLCFHAHVHAEGHNRGHFMGPWPLDAKKKSCILYEALEEFRACATTVQQARYLGLTDDQRDALALGIFLVRFLGYGLDSFQARVKRRSSTREITVGMIFFEMLRQSGAIKVQSTDLGVRLDIDPAALTQSLLVRLGELHEVEDLAACRLKDPEILRATARKWYETAFPSKNSYSPEALSVFQFLNGGSHHAE